MYTNHSHFKVRKMWTLTFFHYSDVMTSQIIGVLIVCPTVCSGADQRKHQGSALLAFVKGIHRWPVDSPHKGPAKRKIFPFDDVIIILWEIQLMAKHRMAPGHCRLLLSTSLRNIFASVVTRVISGKRTSKISSINTRWFSSVFFL